jgi:hypothetical protein
MTSCEPSATTHPQRWWVEERWSLPLVEVSPVVAERVFTLATTKRDGSSNAVSVIYRRRGHLNATLKAAVRRGWWG